MKKNNNESKAILPKLAKKIGEKSVSAASVWWYHQPVVPESMKSKK